MSGQIDERDHALGPGSGTGPGEVTRLLRAARSGDREAFDRLLPLVYDELRQMAGRQLRREQAGHTLNTTALVHEAYLKLVDQTIDWRDRAHFRGIAARAMRQVLIDHARRRGAAKRGGDWQRTSLEPGQLPVAAASDELLALDKAMERLSRIESRLHQVVEYRFFGGMTEEEIAAVLGLTVRTVQRDWVKARAWLYKELYGREAE